MKYISILLLLTLSPFSLHAQLLWEISGNGLSRPSYLYGTVHVGDARVVDLFEQKAFKRFQTSEALIVEMILHPELASSMMNHVFIEGDSTLSDFLTEEQLQIIQNHVSEKLGPASAFTERIKPIFLSMMLHEEITQSETAIAFDAHLQELAKVDGKKIVGLESFEEQMAAFNAIPIGWQAQKLYEEISTTDPINVSDQMISLYLAEDLKGILKTSKSGFPKEANITLIEKRNQTMTSRLLSKLYQQSNFIAIGAAHLYGKNGIIRLLKKEGFKVNPL